MKACDAWNEMTRHGTPTDDLIIEHIEKSARIRKLHREQAVAIDTIVLSAQIGRLETALLMREVEVIQFPHKEMMEILKAAGDRAEQERMAKEMAK